MKWNKMNCNPGMCNILHECIKNFLEFKNLTRLGRSAAGMFLAGVGVVPFLLLHWATCFGTRLSLVWLQIQIEWDMVAPTEDTYDNY